MSDAPEHRAAPLTGSVNGGTVLVAGAVHAQTVQIGNATVAGPRLHPPRFLPPRAATFVGRSGELKQLHRKLCRYRPVGVPVQVGIHGPGGVGKTALVVDYAWTHLRDYPGGLFLVDCAAAEPSTALASLAVPLGLAEADAPDRTARLVKEHLEAGELSILILDNVNDAATWQRWVVSGSLPAGSVRRLVISHSPALSQLDMMTVGRLPPSKGVELLAAYRRDAAARDNKRVVTGIVEWFDGWAVGLTVVGAYMALNDQVSWEAFAGDLTAKGLGAVRGAESSVGPPSDYARRVDAVFDDLMNRLSQAERLVLACAAIMPEDQVVSEWLITLLEEGSPVSPPEHPGYDRPWVGVLAELKRRQLLVPRSEDGRLLSLHRVLRRRVRESLGASEEFYRALQGNLSELVLRRASHFSSGVVNPTDRWELTTLVKACEELLLVGLNQNLGHAVVGLAVPLRVLRRFEEAIPLLESAIKLSEKQFGPDVPFAAQCRMELGLVHWENGEFELARTHLEHALATLKKELGSEDKVTVACMHHLALALTSQGEWSEARAILEQAVGVCERVFAPDDLLLAQCAQSLGNLLARHGEIGPALHILDEAAATIEGKLGANHPSTAVSLLNQARAIHDLGWGNLSSARPFYERALDVFEESLGADHPDTARCVMDLGLLLSDLGDRAGAQELLERAASVFESTLGSSHPETANCLNNLGLVVAGQGDFETARQYLERALAIYERALPPGHVYTGRCLNNLGVQAMGQGDWVTARRYLERALAIAEITLHPRSGAQERIVSALQTVQSKLSESRG